MLQVTALIDNPEGIIIFVGSNLTLGTHFSHASNHNPQGKNTMWGPIGISTLYSKCNFLLPVLEI